MFSSYSDLNSDAFAWSTSFRAQEILSPNMYRAGVYYNGIPVTRSSDGCRVTAYLDQDIWTTGTTATLNILQDDLALVNPAAKLTVYVPVAIPLRLLRSMDIANRTLIDTWYGFFKTVVGTQYTKGTSLDTIANRLTILEGRQEILRQAINRLTTVNVDAWS
jgi:hypothetical protein